MRKLGILSSAKGTDLVEELLRFFQVASHREYEGIYLDLARRYSVHPGILVARLQRIGSLPKKNLNKLKVSIHFA